MCGIAGIYSTNRHDFDMLKLVNMVNKLQHRGPDAEGYYEDSHILLGHRRLSVLDLSTSANQPMHSSCGRYVLAYNGEVYNFREIARDLDVKLLTESDTEVILEAFAKWGKTFVNRLNGMFAIAIYDKQEKELHLFRDRMGIKPLYFLKKDGFFIFASEIKAILSLPIIQASKKLNKEAIKYYLHLEFIPQPMTIYDGIFKFNNGHYMKIGQEKSEYEAYWKLEDQITESTQDNEHRVKAEVTEILESSVKYRLISDVPYGTFFSGGIDSSMITAIAQKNSPMPLNTFTIGFKESKVDDAFYAKQISAHLKTKHHEFILNYDAAMDQFESIYDIFDEPMAFDSTVPNLLVSKMAKNKVTVVLGGDGSDELFLGYGHYQWANRMSNPLIQHIGRVAGMLSPILPNRLKRVSELFKFNSGTNLLSHIFSQEQYNYSEAETHKILNAQYTGQFDLEGDFGYLARNITPAEKQALFDLKYYLKDEMLLRLDHASMHYSLECRVPFLDHRLVSYALNINPKMKIQSANTKTILKNILYDSIPAHYFDRPKWGFAMPVQQWLQSDWKYMLAKYLSKNKVDHFGILDAQEVDALIKRYHNGDVYLYKRIWLLILLQRFLINNFD